MVANSKGQRLPAQSVTSELRDSQVLYRVLGFFPALGWQLVNALVTTIAPRRLHQVQVTNQASADLYHGAVQVRAEELKAAGFVEIGALVEWNALLRESQRVFWHGAVGAYAFLGARWEEPELVLLSQAANGTLLRTSAQNVPSQLEWIQNNPCSGSVAQRLQSHQAALQPLGGAARSMGSLGDAIDLLSTFAKACLGSSPPPSLAWSLDRVPSGIQLNQDHHHVTIVAPRRRGAEWVLGPAITVAVLKLVYTFVDRPDALWAGIVLALVLWAVDSLVRRLWQQITFELSSHRLVVTRPLGKLTFTPSEHLRVEVHGAGLFLDDGERRAQIRVGETATERHWLAHVIRATMAQNSPAGPEVNKKAARMLAHLAARAQATSENCVR